MKNESQIDRIFEQGTSNLSRTPKAPLTDEQIAAAARTSKSGVGIWLLSHLKAIILSVVSFALGVGVALLVTHGLPNRNTTNQTNENEGVAVSDSTTFSDSESSAMTDYPIPSEEGEESLQETNAKPVESLPAKKHAAPSRNPAQAAPAPQPLAEEEPVVVRKVIEQRDTILIKETITIKDTVYVP